jgi:Ca2+-dependent lipid-binding protein
MNPYCNFNVGGVATKGQICKKGGKHPHWTDVITVPVMSNQRTAIVDLKDRDTLTKDDIIGSFTIDLQEIQSR